jgi:hypothetical protein
MAKEGTYLLEMGHRPMRVKMQATTRDRCRYRSADATSWLEVVVSVVCVALCRLELGREKILN